MRLAINENNLENSDLLQLTVLAPHFHLCVTVYCLQVRPWSRYCEYSSCLDNFGPLLLPAAHPLSPPPPTKTAHLFGLSTVPSVLKSLLHPFTRPRSIQQCPCVLLACAIYDCALYTPLNHTLALYPPSICALTALHPHSTCALYTPAHEKPTFHTPADC